MKCNNVGCDKEGYHVQIPIFNGAFYADAYFCKEHYKEGVESLKE